MDKEVSERIKKIEERLDSLEATVKTIGASLPRKEQQTISMSDLLALPSSLQKTILAVQELGEATASRVAEQTKRDRTVENIYLNQLTRLGYLVKERKSRRIYFKILRYY
jgi:uncharacterized protein with PhoU and TrkA domain